MGASSDTREEVRKRLTLIGRNLLHAQAQQALTQEATLSAADVTPQSVAVHRQEVYARIQEANRQSAASPAEWLPRAAQTLRRQRPYAGR